MKRKESTHSVLGVMVTGRAVHAALLHSSAAGTEILRRFTRQRNVGTGEAQGEIGGGLPDMQEDGDDFTLQFGEGAQSGGGNIFLGSEFGDVEREGEVGGVGGSTPAGGEAVDFALELSDILSECRDAGYEDFSMAFCTSASNVEQLEVHLPEEEAGKIKKKALHALLKEQHEVHVERDEVVFLPMTPGESGMGRYLALFARATEPVIPTLRTLHEEQHVDLPPISFLDVETSLYAGLARRDVPYAEAPDESDGAAGTLVVRANSEDTLVVFLQEGQLHHAENLRSLTTFDATETICSRVLLIQDEYGIGEVQSVLLLGEDQEEALVESFSSFFPEARVSSMQTVLPSSDDGEEGGGAHAAVGAATRVLDERRGISSFDEVSFLPDGLLRRRIEMPISWQSVAALAVLFFTVFFFTWRFFSLEADIQEVQQKLDRYAADPVHQNPQVLQARIDSLQGASQELIQALAVLDELLVGSDQWSRSLEKTSREVGAVNSIWIDSWTPQGSSLQLRGNAAERGRIVRLAERMNGAIQELTFAEIREWPVYTFSLKVPLKEELPQAARFLRRHLAARDSAVEEKVPATSASLEE